MKFRMYLTFILVLLIGGFAFADVDPVAENAYAIDNFFLFIAAVLVLFMQAGFAMVEAGLNSAKNTVNILFKNLMDLCIGGLLYFVVGYSLMYGDDLLGGFFGFAGFGISSAAPDAAAGALHPQVDWLFQVAFAATAATIVSGSVAGRMKFVSYLIYSAFITGLVYPISGFWKWGGGWLDQIGFYDFAGSLVVHAVGGFAGLAGAIVLGPRIGRFDGKPKAMPGHNLSLAALGVFVLWVGWYGFNPGSQLAIVGADNTAAVMLIAVNTSLAAMAGGVVAMITAWIMFKKPDLTMALNGVLAGLVGITANCDSVTNGEAIVIGVVAGIIVVFGIKLLDKLKIDDPVGAFPVHGLAGVWGGLATWIFGGHPMVAQIVGSLVIPVWAFATCFVLFSVLKAAGILRVSAEDELRGLDISEHGEEAYNGFQFFTTQ
ncbi:MAG: ammonium transporter [Calditrichae bacterium]|nr:ammonium transporter [Calditrichota bacterium]MCB9058982.1 ammonium transporter [Calditrichia bacterium]